MCAINWKTTEGNTLPSTQRVQTGRDLPTSWKSLEFAGEIHLLQAFSSVWFNLFFLLLLTEECWFHSARFLVYLSSPLKSHSLCYGAVQTHLSLLLGQPPPHTHTHMHMSQGHSCYRLTHNLSLPPSFIHLWVILTKPPAHISPPKKINNNNNNNNIHNGNSKCFT